MTMTRAHGTSSAPGIVVIVLAVAAIVWGLAVVRTAREPATTENISAALAPVREELAELAAEIDALNMRLNELEHAARGADGR